MSIKLVKPKIILDFDYTLFDTGKFKNALARSFEQWKVPPQDFFKTYPLAIRRHNGEYSYNIKKHILLLKKNNPKILSVVALSNITKIIVNSKKYLYPEATHFLSLLKKRGYQLMLVTHGDKTLQQRKLKYSGIVHFFKKIEITRHLKANALKKWLENHEAVVFVSDHIDEVRQVKKCFPDWLVIVKLGSHNQTRASGLVLPKFSKLLPIEKFIRNYLKIKIEA